MTIKTDFFERWSWFKFKTLGFALGMDLKLCSSLPKALKLKIRKSRGLILSFWEKTDRMDKLCYSPILNRFKQWWLLFKKNLKIANMLNFLLSGFLKFNSFFPNAAFLYLLKTSENIKIFWCLQGLEKGCIGKKWVNCHGIGVRVFWVENFRKI